MELSKLNFRVAEKKDWPFVVSLLHDDDFGQNRESVDGDDGKVYESVFKEFEASKYFEIIIMELSDEVIGCFQIMYLPHLSFMGASRAQVESIRIRSDLRGKGLGTELMKNAIKRGKEKGCKIFQLTSNKERTEANKFYRNLGLRASHDGYKLYY